MPYIITRSAVDFTPVHGEPWHPVKTLSRVAVATLEEACETAWTIIDEAEEQRGDLPGPSRDAYSLAVADLPESGGTVGPLPYGTIIGVELATWEALREMRPPAGCTERNRAVWPPTWSKLHQGEIILAFNAS